MTMPSTENMESAREAAAAKERFWRQNYPEFVKRYAKKFVAVVNEEIVDSDADLLALWTRLEQRGIAGRDVWVKFIGRDYARLIL
jgi:hypothetical protein